MDVSYVYPPRRLDPIVVDEIKRAVGRASAAWRFEKECDFVRVDATELERIADDLCMFIAKNSDKI